MSLKDKKLNEDYIEEVVEETIEEYKTRKRTTPFQDTLFNHAVNVLQALTKE